MAGPNDTNGGDDQKKKILTNRNVYIAAAVAVPTLTAAGLGVMNYLQHNKIVDFEKRTEATQGVVLSGFSAERDNLRRESIEALKANPSMDALNEAVCEYTANMRELAEEYHQDDFTDEHLQADVSGFSAMARNEVIKVSLPLAQKRIQSASDAFDTYVEDSAKNTALNINPDDTGSGKYDAIMQKYRAIQDEAANYADEKVEVPTFEQFFEKVALFYDRAAEMRHSDRSVDIPTADMLGTFMHAEATLDRKYIATTKEMMHVFLEAYKRNLMESVFEQTMGLMKKTDEARQSTMDQIGDALDEAGKASTGTLIGNGTN